MAVFVVAGCQTTGGGTLPPNSGLDVCSDYGSAFNCIGNSYNIPRYNIYSHQGMDFAAPAGTEVISATNGLLYIKEQKDCEGYGITIETDIEEKDKEGFMSTVYARYLHVKPADELDYGKPVKAGDLIGYIIPVPFTECHSSVEHAHYELRISNLLELHTNPNKYWVNGPGKVTCFKEGMTVPTGKTVAPLRCR